MDINKLTESLDELTTAAAQSTFVDSSLVIRCVESAREAADLNLKPHQVPEIEMHRADYQAIQNAGFQCPGELLAAYQSLLEASQEKVKENETSRQEGPSEMKPQPLVFPPFPVMLRKMWSGSEVQDWIDKNVDAYNAGVLNRKSN